MSDQQQTLTIQQAIDLGVQHHKAGRLPEAENVYQQILQSNPDQPVALHLLGVIAHQVGKNDVAVDLITKALAIKPDYAEAYNNLGRALQDLGKLDEAVASYHKALGLKPDYAKAHSNLGNALKGLGKLDEAVASYRKALAIKPDFAETYYNLGNALQDLGKLDQAVASYHKALAIKPDYAEAHSNLGAALKDLGKLEDAVTNYQKALTIKPDLAEAHNNLGTALKVLGRHEEAAAHCQKTINLKPDFAEAHYNLGVALKELGKLEDAVAAYHKALGLKPAYPMAYTNLLECVYALGDRDRFYQELEKIILEDTTNVGVAAISAFASNQFGCHDPYPFCNSPMDFVSVNSIASTTEKESGLLHEIQKQIAELKLGNRSQSRLKSGIQSSGNLFSEPCGALADLNQIIRDEISNYFAKHQTSDCLFIKMWPREYTLKGWYILMEKGGHLAPHNHPRGWLSGVIYLKMPAREANEGSIEFSLHGNNFPVLDSEYPKKLYRVMEGDLVMFPSSLFHRTMPFYSDETRLSISFDLHLI